MDPIQNAKVIDRLRSNGSLADLGLPTVDGRVDLRGLVLTAPTPLGQIKTHAVTATIAAVTELRGAHWTKLDFSKAKLPSLRMFSCVIDDCVFDVAELRGLRSWGTTVRRARFRATDLRDAALGGVDGGTRSVFEDVDFTKTNLRGSAFDSPVFRRCRFVNANLRKVDFDGSAFEDCAFEGVLEETEFAAVGSTKGFPPNEMKNVDFSKATLRSVAFRGLALDTVRWPAGPEHIVITDYVRTIDRVIAALRRRSDDGAKQLAAYLGVMRNAAHPAQRVGVLHRGDLVEYSSADAVREMDRVIADGSAEA